MSDDYNPKHKSHRVLGLMLAPAAIVALIVGVSVIVSCSDSGDGNDGNTGNDRILLGDEKQFIEVFRKDDAGGDKNYQYTITEFTDSFGRECTVVTGASETAIALDCVGD